MKVLFSFFIALFFISITQAQNVGIGTLSPVAKLVVLSDPNSPSIPGTSSTGILRLGTLSSNEGIDIGKLGTAPYSGWIQAGVNGNFADPVSLQPLGGNLGIGTVAPTSKLEVLGNSGNVSIPGTLSTGILRVAVSANGGIDIGKLGTVPFTGWIQAGINGTTADPISLQPLGGNLGIGTLTPDTSAKLDISSDTKGFLPPRMDAAHRNSISSPALGLTIYNTSSKSLESWNGVSWSSVSTGLPVHYIGESYGGGIVFYVYENGQHGLISATSDQSTTGVQWYNGTYTTTNAIRDGIGAFSYNTEHIIASQGAGNYAAMLCATYQGGGFGDWYLPSKYELNLLYLQRTVVGGFAGSYYWSSSEDGYFDAWEQYFGDGGQGSAPKGYVSYVRAVRAF